MLNIVYNTIIQPHIDYYTIYMSVVMRSMSMSIKCSSARVVSGIFDRNVRGIDIIYVTSRGKP